ncbi:hypothetical protein [Marinobacter sp. M-5]|uniref:hypothetical protein n=1 Tax=Marinobacter sp. M-5 TaxID=3081089 RepID=UPI00293CCFA0|nr:hypothetical protein [Marinobacter sp. M-5]MDV3503711.1 hypothetical protein [Marinobacter sp. M-5]
MKKDGDESLNRVRLPSSEADLLNGLDEDSVHGDELAELTPRGLDPLERLRGSVKGYKRPTDPVWQDYFDGDSVSEDFMIDRDQTSSKEKK